ncbi:MAG TPA: tetratricopeptide repeat protein [Methanotrichaceae archaeon]|nr:tetratricopeptide repeat protein [Methanotrichaceae archaeon]
MSRRNISWDAKYSIARYPDHQNDVADLKQAVKKAIDDLGGIGRFVKPGDKVLIKANICGGTPDNIASYTSKDLVGHVVDLVIKAGGRPAVCDADMIWTKFWENAREMGWDRWAKERDVDLINLSDTELVYFDFGEGTIFQDNERPNKEIVSKRLLDADVIISIPKMKTHLYTGVTLGMKNMYGTLPMMDKAQYHKKGIDEVIYWINRAFTPTLTVVDGTVGGEAVGPLSVTPVEFNTVVASNNVALADAVSSKLMGFDRPFEEINHLKLAKEGGLVTGGQVGLEQSASEMIRDLQLPENSKDGMWVHADSGVVDDYKNLMENLLAIPYMDTFFNIGADFLLFDAARIPLLKYVNNAILQLLYEAPRRLAGMTRETKGSRQRMRINTATFSMFAALSLYFFITKGYLGQVSSKFSISFYFMLGLMLALVVGVLFARMMKTRHLQILALSSLVTAYIVEGIATRAQWWDYYEFINNYSPRSISLVHSTIFTMPDLPAPPRFALFIIPIFIISVIGISYFLRSFFEYVGLGGTRFRLIPYTVTLIALVTFLTFEGYLSEIGTDTWIQYMIVIYAAFAVIGLYFNYKQTTDWNLALTITAVAAGGVMELLGGQLSLWVYPGILETKILHMPIFVSFTWALNIWAACGLAMILGADISDAFVDTEEAFDKGDRYDWCNKGNALKDQDRYYEAIESYEKAIEIDPQFVKAWYGKGTALASLGDFKGSLISYDEALKIDPKNAEVWGHKADALQYMGRLDEAVNAYNEAIRIDPGDCDLWIDKALAVQRQGKFEESLEIYYQAIESVPIYETEKLAELWDFRGFAGVDSAGINGHEMGAYENAIRDFDKAIALSTKDDIGRFWVAAAWWGKGSALAKLGRYEESLGAFDKLDLYSENNALAWSDKGDAFQVQGRHDEAIRAYDRAIVLYPDLIRAQSVHSVQSIQAHTVWEDTLYKFMAQTWKGKGDSLFRINRRYEAFKAYERSKEILEKYVRNSDALSGKGYLLSEMGFYEEALEAYDKAIEVAQSSSSSQVPVLLAKAWTGKGNVFSRTGRDTEALEALDKALEIDPSYAPAHESKVSEASPGHEMVWQHRGMILRMICLYNQLLPSE